jgi:energy-coupling factor transport system ATP-binding protein
MSFYELALESFGARNPSKGRPLIILTGQNKFQVDENPRMAPARHATANGFGLGLLPPIPRLLLVIILTSSFVWISTVRTALLAFGVGLILIGLNKSKNISLLLFVLPITMISYFFGNLLFSPMEAGGAKWWVFRVNEAGFRLGAVGAFKRGAMVVISLAWLSCTSIPQMYQSLKFIKPSTRWIMLFLRNIQSVRRELILCRQSLLIRDISRPWFDAIGRLNQLKLLLQAILLRFFENIANTTYASETHHFVKNRSAGAIRLEGVTVRYSEDQPLPLHDVSLHIPEGECVFLGGVNGAGKTTLMRVMSGYVPSIKGEYAGTVQLARSDIGDMPLSEVSNLSRYVPSDPMLSIIGLTSGQDITLTARNDHAARGWLQSMGLQDRWNQEVTKLSGGEQMRLVLAGMLASEVPIALLDSPLEQLDWIGRRDFIKGLKEFRIRAPRTVIVSDYSFEEFRPFIDRFLLIDKGVIVHDCRPDQVTNEILVRAGLSTHQFASTRLPEPVRRVNTPVAEMRNVHVILDECEILKDMSLAIHPGECAAIMGPNGSGKTTAMLALAGLIPLAGGEVAVRGRVGYVFQNPALQIIETTVRAELEIGPKMRGWPQMKRESFVQQQLPWLGLTGEEWPGDLHVGQIRMLSIATMEVDVEIMIFDEPTIGLDYPAIQKFVKLVDELLRSGVAIIIITHDRSLAKIGSRVIFMDCGKVTADGDPHELVEKLTANQ